MQRDSARACCRYTDHTPKAAVSHRRPPLLDRVIGSLCRAGCRAAVVNTHHLADRIEAFIRSRNYPIPVFDPPRNRDSRHRGRHSQPGRLLGPGSFHGRQQRHCHGYRSRPGVRRSSGTPLPGHPGPCRLSGVQHRFGDRGRVRVRLSANAETAGWPLPEFRSSTRKSSTGFPVRGFARASTPIAG